MGLVRGDTGKGKVFAVQVERKPLEKFPETTMTKERSVAYEAVRSIMSLHRASESNARWAAARTALRLRDQGTRKLAEDRGYLTGIATAFGVHDFHVELYIDVVQCLCKMLPVGNAEVHQSIMVAFKKLDEEEARLGKGEL